MGFAASNNQALSAARGELFVMLNNDTIVPPGWLEGLAAHLDDPGVGLAGPVTNRAGNEAQIETDYRTYGEFLDFAAARAGRGRGERSELRVATMFCAAMRRAVFKEIGPLDERFEIGLFEDDDYSMRVRKAGYRVVCAEDVFVHHFGQASIGKLAAEGRYGELFHANRRRWEEKWQQPWQPYEKRPVPAYQAMAEQIREVVDAHLPRDARVLVVSKGDDDLLQLGGRQGRHFPADDKGRFAGYNPASGAEAIDQVEAAAEQGFQFLLLPATALWWLDHYRGLAAYLDAHARVVVRRADVCLIYELCCPGNCHKKEYA
jgi:GT2 family glycosyltransferase